MKPEAAELGGDALTDVRCDDCTTGGDPVKKTAGGTANIFVHYSAKVIVLK
jgi:uncharacterized protein YbjQ (UPF0145 family)